MLRNIFGFQYYFSNVSVFTRIKTFIFSTTLTAKSQHLKLFSSQKKLNASFTRNFSVLLENFSYMNSTLHLYVDPEFKSVVYIIYIADTIKIVIFIISLFPVILTNIFNSIILLINIYFNFFKEKEREREKKKKLFRFLQLWREDTV